MSDNNTVTTIRPTRLVFISHASEDADFVRAELIPVLERAGIVVWFSPTDLTPAARWPDEIRAGLESSPWFLVVMSPRSADSRWVAREVDWAMEERHGRIVPVLIETTDLRKWHVGLRAVQFIDFRHNRQEGCARLLSVFGVAKPTPQVAVSPPQVSAVPPTEPGPKKKTELLALPKQRVSPTRQACLVCIYPAGPAHGTRFLIGQEALTIGRGDGCDIQMEGTSISRQHARIEASSDGHFVIDQQSTNGTFVNRAQLDGPWGLQDGDYLQVGNVIFRYIRSANIDAAYHEEVHWLTIHDGLTRAHNQRHLVEFLERELARSSRAHHPLAVVTLDIDHFRAVNERYGHIAGDLILQDLAARVRGRVDKENLFARVGGAEFTLVLVDTIHDTATGESEAVRAAVAASPFDIGGGALVPVTVSIGVANTTCLTPLTPAELLRTARQRLRLAKQQGRNAVCGTDGALAEPGGAGESGSLP